MHKVRFACPRCQTIMQTGAEKVGYDVACPHCAHRFRLVDSGNSRSPERSDSQSASDASTLPPSSFPKPGGLPGVGDLGGMNPANPGAVESPYTQKPAPHPIDSGGISPVVGSYPTSSIQPGFCCPYCHTNQPPIWKSEVSQIGWIVFAVLLATTCVCCFIGLFIRDKYRICSQCKIRLS